MYPIYLDPKKFKGFALVNTTTNEIAVRIRNESAFDIHFIMKSKDIYYCRVADVVEFMPIDWAKNSYITYLEDFEKLKDRRGKIR